MPVGDQLRWEGELNVAFPSRIYAVKGNNPASPAHFLNHAGLFTGRRRRAALPRETHQWVSFFLLFLFFLVIARGGFVPLLCCWEGLRVAECS